MKNHTLLNYGDPKEVCIELDEEVPTNSELRSALVNALNRIAVLESQVIDLCGEVLKK